MQMISNPRALLVPTIGGSAFPCRFGRMVAAGALLVASIAGASPAAAGGMLVSNRDRSLAINAWGGAANGTVLRLHNACRPENRDCTWTFRGGMLISDSNPNLKIKATGTDNGAGIVLAADCQPNNPACTWTYRDGMFVSNARPPLAINAWGGARYGTVLKLSDRCRPDNPDCTWSR